MATLSFVDAETTGLGGQSVHRDDHEIWEAALVQIHEDGTRQNYLWQLPVDLGRADPMALEISQYYERFGNFDYLKRAESLPGSSVKYLGETLFGWSSGGPTVPNPVAEFAAEFAELTAGTHLYGLIPSFDEERLWKLLRRNGACPRWHYHIIDLEAMMVGFAMGMDRSIGFRRFDPTPPWKSDDLLRSIGINMDEYERHSSIWDAKLAADAYEKILK